uniref:Solute carrier family 41 member n=1 Tax=Haplochromis burtoni TaxID=8153 RepID=A0A3Q2V3U0_HAPBU
DYTGQRMLNMALPGQRKRGRLQRCFSDLVRGVPTHTWELLIVVPFLLAGLGTVSAGILLDIVQSWEVFQEITEILILVPAVLGMKGNLEMTLASRLSTAVTEMRMYRGVESVLCLLKSTMTSLVFLVFSSRLFLGVERILEGAQHTALWGPSIVMVGVIIGSKRIGINPDNVATPIAASFGDLITLALLACKIISFFFLTELYPYVLYLVNLSFLCLIPAWVAASSKHPASEILLHTGWEPIIIAMLISSIGGVILDKTVLDPNLAGIIVYAPVINGQFCAGSPMHVLRMFAYASVLPGTLICIPNHRSAKILLLLVIPGQLIFLHVIHLIKGGHTLPSPLFTIAFLFASLIQVLILLCMADCLVHCLWRRGKDPDSYSIPYLTALGDLLGTALLSIAFLMLWCIGDPGSV